MSYKWIKFEPDAWAFSREPCIFLDLEDKGNGEKTCSIHPVKPYVGRMNTCSEGIDK